MPGSAAAAAAATTTAVVLAAGQGTRMGSDEPKVVHQAAGRPLLAWVLEAARAAGCGRTIVVVGYRADRVREVIGESLGPARAEGIDWVLQEEQLGTGHALAQAEAAAAGRGMLLVLSGDAPLVRPETLRALLAAAAKGWGALAVAELDDPGSLGRVVARPGAPDTLERIVEAADATADELAVRTVNAGFYALPAPDVFDDLSRLDRDNAQGELYLTDALSAAARRGEAIRLVRLADPAEALGANTPAELARIDRLLGARTPRPV